MRECPTISENQVKPNSHLDHCVNVMKPLLADMRLQMMQVEYKAISRYISLCFLLLLIAYLDSRALSKVWSQDLVFRAFAPEIVLVHSQSLVSNREHCLNIMLAEIIRKYTGQYDVSISHF